MNNRLRVLLVEDNPGDADLVQEYLSQAEQVDFDVECVSRLATAISLLKGDNADVILLDLGLPDSTGLDTLSAALKAAQKKPIIVLTGRDDQDLGLESIKMGAQDYLPKGSLSPDLLIRTVLHSIERKRLQDKLRMNELRLRLAQEAAKAGTWEWNLETNENFWSEELWALYGLEPRSCKPSYQTWLDSIHPEDREAAGQTVREAASQGLEIETEWRVANVMKVERWLMSRGRPVRDEHGQVLRYAGIVMDITERKESEELLRETAWNLAEAQRVGRIGSWSFDSVTEKVRWSDEVYRIFGIEKQDFGNTYESFINCVHSDDQECVLETNARARSTGVEFDFDYRIVLPSGQVKTIREVGYAQRDHNGHVTGLFGTAQDITDRKQAEELLRKAGEEVRREKDKLLSMLNAMNDGVYIVNQQHEIQYVNPVIESEFGCAEGRKCHQYFHDMNEPCPWCKNSQVFAGESVAWEWRSGKTGKTYELFDTPIRNDDGSISKIEFFHDITNRKRAEAAVRESERRYRDLWEKAPVMMISLDSEARIEFASDRICEELGYSRDELLGRRPFEFQTEASAQYAQSVVFRAFLHTGLVKDAPLQFVRKNGEVIDVLLNVTAERDEHGNVIRSRSVLIDVTERNRAQQAMRESEARYVDLYENAPDMYATVDAATGRVIQCNETMSTAMGYSKEELIGRPVEEIYHPDSRDKSQKAFQLFRATGMVRNAELQLLRADGGSIDVILNASAVYDDTGKILHSRSILRDVTDLKRTEEALQKSEERWQFALEGAGDGVWDWNASTNRVFYSTRWKSMLGYGEDEIGDGLDEWEKRVHPEDKLGCQRELERYLRGEIPEYRSEHRVLCKDGTYKWILDRGKVIQRTNEGEPLRVIGTHTDITLLKQAEENLYSEKQRFERLAENSPFGMVIILTDGTFSYLNPKFVEMFGYDQSDVRNGREWFRRAFPDSAYRHEVISTWIQDRQGHQVEDNIQRMFRVTCKNGAEKIALFRPVKLHSGESMVTCEDITQRIMAEEALERSETRYRQLADVTFEAILFHDDGVLIRSNDQFCQMFGYDPDELVGTQIMDRTLTPESRQVVRDHIDAQSTDSYEAIGMKKDGTTFPLEIRARIQEAEGKSIRAVAIRDLTERRHLEAQFLQAQKMEAVGTLAGGVAHDFNNLLQVVIGYSELLLAGKQAGDPDHGELTKILGAGKRGADLVENLMMFSRKVQPNLKPVNLNDEIVQIQKLLSRTIPKSITINLRLSGDLRLIEADLSQMGQVLMNLCVNARDAMPNGGTVTLETMNVELDQYYCASHLDLKPGFYALLSVSDSGLGMDKETLSHIFEPFFTTKELGRGTGLGLSTVFGIIKQHHGDIHCYSEPGQGTTFKIYLPAIEREVESEIEASQTQIIGGTETILLVDDEDDLRDLGATILRRYGYEVLTAENGREAVDTYRREREKISLIVLDLIMPEMDGKKCLAEILNINPRANVLIASGHSEGLLSVETSLRGAKGLVAKPYEIRKLLKAVREVLGTVG